MPVSINKRLSALSSEQLTELLGNLINKHPDLKEVFDIFLTNIKCEFKSDVTFNDDKEKASIQQWLKKNDLIVKLCFKIFFFYILYKVSYFPLHADMNVYLYIQHSQLDLP